MGTGNQRYKQQCSHADDGLPLYHDNVIFVSCRAERQQKSGSQRPEKNNPRLISGSEQAGLAADVYICPDCTISANEGARRNRNGPIFSPSILFLFPRIQRPGPFPPACQTGPALRCLRQADAGQRSAQTGQKAREPSYLWSCWPYDAAYQRTSARNLLSYSLLPCR